MLNKKFGIVTRDNITFFIVKKEIAENGKIPSKYPFEIYGIIYIEKEANTTSLFRVKTDYPFEELELDSLVKQASTMFFNAKKDGN